MVFDRHMRGGLHGMEDINRGGIVATLGANGRNPNRLPRRHNDLAAGLVLGAERPVTRRQYSTRPPIIVISTRMLGSSWTGTASGFSDRITRSAHFPAARLPLRCSSKVAQAALMVSSDSACFTVMVCASIQGSGDGAPVPIRVAASNSNLSSEPQGAPSGSGAEHQGQSLPPAVGTRAASRSR